MTRPPRRSAGRLATGIGVAVVLIPLTVYLAAVVPRVTVSSALLVLLLEVVLVAALTNVVVAVITAVGAVLLANWYLVQPSHTFLINNPDDVVLLGVFVATAVGASLVVTTSLRYREAATRSEVEAAALRASVGTAAEEADPDAALRRIVDIFRLDHVALVGAAGTVVAAAPSGAAPAGADAAPNGGGDDLTQVQVDLPDEFHLTGTGPGLLGADRRVMVSLATAALRSWQARQLAEEAGRAQELAAMDRARSALLASVGHDLRTPIAAISVAAAALRSDVALDPADRAELIDTVSASAARLDELVANLLDMSRLEAGQLIANRQAVDVEPALAQAALDTGSPLVQVRAGSSGCRVSADPGLLDRVLANLLSNALRHSPPGQPVTLTAERHGDRISLAVVDHGPGLPAASYGDVFRPFQRLDDSSRGVGLGLAIARGFVEAMGGSITPRPTPGGGLTMVVELDAAP